MNLSDNHDLQGMLQKRYDNKLSATEAEEATHNLLGFFQALLAIHNDRCTNHAAD